MEQGISEDSLIQEDLARGCQVDSQVHSDAAVTSLDRVGILGEMEAKLSEVSEGGIEDVVLDLGNSVVQRVEVIRASYMNEFASLLEELGENELAKLLLNAGIYPYESVVYDCKTFYAGKSGDYHSGCLVDRYKTYDRYSHINACSSYYDPGKRTLMKYFVEGFNSSSDIVLLRRIGERGLSEYSIWTCGKGYIDCSPRKGDGFCVAENFRDYCFDDDLKLNLHRINGEGREWVNLQEKFVRVDFKIVDLREFLDLRSRYLELRRKYRYYCKKYKEICVDKWGFWEKYGPHYTYPDNDDYFGGGELDVDSLSVESLRNEVDVLEPRITAYPRILQLMRCWDWGSLKSEFPKGRIMAKRFGRR